MAIDLQSETVVSLTQATKALPPIDGRRIHVSTLWRWARKGVRGVRLEHIRLGHRVCTSLEALNRFAQSLADAQEVSPSLPQAPLRSGPKSRSAAQRDRDIAAAEAELEVGGV